MNPSEVATKRALRARAQISAVDVMEAHSALLQLMPTPPIPDPRMQANRELQIRRAILVHTVIAYCRPFKHSNVGSAGQSAPSLTLEQLGVALPTDLLALHRQLIDLRDTFIAHSDFSEKYLFQVLEGGRGNREYAFQMLSSWPEIDALDLHRLDQLISYVQLKCSDLAGDISNEFRAAGLE
jgi:hypothetical protein